MSDANFSTGAVRSSDSDHLDFASLPMIGLIAVARTAREGGDKYGRYNYMRGMPLHVTLNHAFRHLVMFTLGDRSEPHLAHAAWGLLAMIQELALNPQGHREHMLGPGATITEEMMALLEEQKEALATRRKNGEFSGTWSVEALPEVTQIVGENSFGEVFLALDKAGPCDPIVVDPGRRFSSEKFRESEGPYSECTLSIALADYEDGLETSADRFWVSKDATRIAADEEIPASRVVYLAGPMTGHEDHNFPAFREAEAALKESGFEVISPATYGANAEETWRDCMIRDLHVLVTCGAIALLDGWENSKGASLEAHVGLELGLTVLPIEEFFC